MVHVFATNNFKPGSELQEVSACKALGNSTVLGGDPGHESNGNTTWDYQGGRKR